MKVRRAHFSNDGILVSQEQDAVYNFEITKTVPLKDIFADIKKGDWYAVVDTIDAYPDLIESKDQYGRAPLILAVLQNQELFVKKLLERNADPNCKDKDNNTALHVAAALGSFEIVQMLKDANANVFAKNKKGDLPYSWARDVMGCVPERKQVVDFLHPRNNARPNLLNGARVIIAKTIMAVGHLNPF